MRRSRPIPVLLFHVRRCVMTLCGLALVLAPSALTDRGPDAAAMSPARAAVSLVPAAGTTSTCEPPGPAPRFGCQWSVDVCDWICPVCDPFGAPPRSSCTWDGTLCDWVCPGYTGVRVAVQTLQPPDQDATVYVRLSSLCTATGAGAFCNGSFPVHAGTTVAQKCQAIADVVAGSCTAAGYAVTGNDCGVSASLTVSNAGCPATPFALGLSNDPAVFDQTGQGALPDGESDTITGTMEACTPMPGPVTNLQLATLSDGDLQLTWDAAANADDYVVFSDTAPNGSFTTVAGTAPDGAAGLTIPMPPGLGFYLVAARNSTCGVGPER